MKHMPNPDTPMSLNISNTAEVDDSVTFGPNCRKINVGHATRIRSGVYIDVVNLSIGDYVTLSPGVVIHGENPSIGHNCWVGQYSILDGHGGRLRLGNNVGVGAHSQLWSHMKFGDRLAGCRWYRMSELVVEDDVWFVGHCLVSPIIARSKSMLLLGGLATQDMEENQIYAGAPAQNVSDRFGRQFEPIPTENKYEIFESYLQEFGRLGNDTRHFRVVVDGEVPKADSFTYFDLDARIYYPTFSPNETMFIRFLLYDRKKFVPVLRSAIHPTTQIDG